MAGRRSVSVARVVPASAAAVFDIITAPAAHAELDGSGMLRGQPDGPERLGPGERFAMAMRQAGVRYRSVNTVVEYEPDRLIAWETWGEWRGRRTVGGQRWRYQLVPLAEDRTRVVHTYDWSGARFPLLVELPGYPRRMAPAMSATLARLAEAAGRDRPAPPAADGLSPRS
ncbi:SRPBCC family protein [Marinitenerispora sediminis]|uniref:Dimethyladenosine transferase n=1 Tax=Marinitenerispora sediminis TaxID=1931232 RepID=A0A368T9U0_9ACTN|nr:SRPBCC family protein [Marinitenerispora sediminis]RCV52293.1 hypothetical protein DEF28_13280 [Marinitenerispora sediminis]RCV58833.1 hypothetical protein DEF23_08155 [Marinitenerispora sediminis]RCV59351.1 hypothetical protein DEF24_09755 [Marinitenerispora sediminis]